MLRKSIDYTILEEDLQTVLQNAELYKLQNDAKFRAIEQSVPTYDSFKEMVSWREYIVKRDAETYHFVYNIMATGQLNNVS